MKYIKPHLSPELRARITPHNRRDMRMLTAGIFFLLSSLGMAYNLWPKNHNSSISNNKTSATNAQSTSQITDQKLVLGATSEAVEPEQFTEYIVKIGDTLFNISTKYNVRWDSIASINNLSEPYVLHAGQALKIPQATTSKVQNKVYTIKNGETLASIAKQFNVTTDDIIAVNPNLQKSDLITEGQIIKLP
jgi:LysM repeat protein